MSHGRSEPARLRKQDTKQKKGPWRLGERKAKRMYWGKERGKAPVCAGGGQGERDRERERMLGNGLGKGMEMLRGEGLVLPTTKEEKRAEARCKCMT